MATQKSTLATAVAEEIGRADLATKAEEWYDQALRIILAGGLASKSPPRWSWLVATATRTAPASTASIRAPLDVRYVKAFVVRLSSTDEWKLEAVPPDRFREKYAGSSTSRPIHYSHFGANFLLGPPLDQEYTLQLDYWYIHPAVSADGVSMLPDSIEDIQRLYMLWRGYDYLREGEKAKEKLAIAEGLLTSAMEQDKDRDDDTIIWQPFVSQAQERPTGEYWRDPFA